MKKVKIIAVKAGTCPYCGDVDIDYGCSDSFDDMHFYPAHCNGCGRDFTEVYELTFCGASVGPNQDIEAEEGMEVEFDEDEEESL